MSPRKKSFGELLREKRMAKEITLRRFAEKLDLSPTYISQIEQGNFDPPPHERVRQMAILLGEDPDELLAAAGRMAEDVAEIVDKKPIAIAGFLREARGLTPEQLQRLTEQARKMNQDRKSKDVHE